MKRQAMARAKAEEKNGGLVILHASYKVDGGDELDTTIQLQFWTSRGTLELPPGSKKHLLGFYDVSTAITSDRNRAGETETQKSWWSFGADHTDSQEKVTTKAETHHNEPTLTVRYHFSGNEYEITIQDEEALILPNPKARVVKVDQ
mmetsp:Transcript_11317/g.13673  ORF Transcript_11317/g.13673 Transcript_11317/m.13673 type:complete len:147 (-) Transcript_11317:59-499(-)